MANKSPTPTPDDLERVGTLPSDVPDAPVKKKGWFGRGGRPPIEVNSESNQEAPSSGKWSPSAKEELERFKGVPVVGGLPWRTQYLTLAVVLAVSLVVVVLGALSSRGAGSQGVAEHQAVAATVRSQAMTALSGGQVSAEDMSSALEKAKQLPVSPEWRAFTEAAEGWLTVEQRWIGLAQSAQDTASRLETSVSEVQALWPEMEQEGSSARPEATELARVLGAYGTLSAKLAGVSRGQAVPTASERSAVASGFQAFRGSELTSRSDLAITRAWRSASSSWGQVSPALGELTNEGVSDLLSQRNQSLFGLMSASENWTVSSSRPAFSGPGILTKIAAFMALASLALLLMVAWKQQRWHMLGARSVSEQVDQAVFDLVNDLSPMGHGDLTHRARVSELPIGMLADTLNQGLGRLRQLVALAKKTASETSDASLRANEATGVLVDSQRARLAGLESSSQDILHLIESVGVVASDAQTSKELTARVFKAAESGQGSVVSSLERMHDIQGRVDEAAARAQRLVESSNEIAGMATTLKEIAEQLEILGMQADLQASKAGESGQGFKVVAREVQLLSEASGVRARHVSSLVETALSDLEALSASMKSAGESVAEGSRLTDVNHEAWEEVVVSLDELSACVDSLHGSSVTQKELASMLDERTRGELSQVETDNKNAQEASEATLKLVASVRALDEAVSKFKA